PCPVSDRGCVAKRCHPGNSAGGGLEGILSLLASWNDSRARPAKESTMTSKPQNAESRPLDDHELDLSSGGFFLMEEVVTINQVAIIMGMQLPAPQVVRKP